VKKKTPHMAYVKSKNIKDKKGDTLFNNVTKEKNT
jgi:hypothetical protein